MNDTQTDTSKALVISNIVISFLGTFVTLIAYYFDYKKAEKEKNSHITHITQCCIYESSSEEQPSNITK